MTNGWVQQDLDWSGWRVRTDQYWTRYARPDVALPDQGWKIHLSARMQDADEVCARSAVFCRTAGWPFKHLVDVDALGRSNGKDAPRASSGKFVTIYPPASEVGEALLEHLAALLRGCHGPRILGDLRWRDSIVHVRYGAFRSLATWDGKLAVWDPSGHLVPDRRGVVFDPPDWLDLPSWVTAERLRTAAPDEALSRMSVTGAYSFSNAGGVYRAAHDVHGEVVLKEGREFVAEHAGLDAASRLEHENEVLQQLEAAKVAPRTFGTFRSSGSAFTVIERVPGTPFNRTVMSLNPLTAAAADRGRLDDHERTVRTVAGAIEREVTRLHASGAVHGDLSPRNVLVESPTAVRLIDFESCVIAGQSVAPGPATPGFSAPTVVTGPDRDWFAVACLHLAALVPLTELFPLDAGKIEETLAAAASWFPNAPVDALRSTFGRCVVLPIPDAARTTLPDVAETRSAVQTRMASTGPDVRAGLEHGVDGLRLALERSGVDTGAADAIDEGSFMAGVGLFSGAASKALLGCTDPRLLAGLRAAALDLHRVDLENGLAGIGLALLCAPARAVHRETIELIAGRLTAFSADHDRAPKLAPGLRNGSSGIALFLALHGRLHDDASAVEAARRLVELDLQRMEYREGWGLQLRDGSRLVPFLGSGSAGVGIALVQVIRATSDGSLLPVLHDVAASASPAFTAHPGLLDGRAGLVHFLVDVGELGATPSAVTSVSERLDEHRRRLALHRLQTADGVAYPDRHLRAVDDGWGHGGAGILSALAAIEDFERGHVGPQDTPSFLRGGRR
jgi:tRNA A-37 threonylcarbamoyl transferase component Bud32